MEVTYFENFGIYVPVKEVVKFEHTVEYPKVLVGAEVYETLCPINPLTGHRENPLTILQKALSPNNQRLLDQVLCELPSIQEMDVSDDVKLEMLFSRLDTGTFAERDQVMKQLDKVSSVLFPDNPEQQNAVKDSVINFDSSDNPDNGSSDA